MTQQTTVSYLDDIDGSLAAETILFALDGYQYEIDVSANNATRFRKALAQYLQAARRVDGLDDRNFTDRRAPVARAAKNGNNGDVAAIRAWAEGNGIAVASRGRLPQGVKERYAAWHLSVAS